MTDDIISESFLLEQRFLCLRSLTLRAIAAAVGIVELPDHHASTSSSSSSDARGRSKHSGKSGTASNEIVGNCNSNSNSHSHAESFSKSRPEKMAQVVKTLVEQMEVIRVQCQKDCGSTNANHSFTSVQVRRIGLELTV